MSGPAAGPDLTKVPFPTMNDDEFIQELLNQVRPPDGSPNPRLRSRALTKLLMYIQTSPKLWRSSHQDYSSALNRTLEWVSVNISQFEARSPAIAEHLMHWVNGYLKWRIRDLFCTDHTYQQQTKSIDQSLTAGGEGTLPLQEQLADPRSLTTLTEQLIQAFQETETRRFGQQIQTYLRHDPERWLQDCGLRKQPTCNCQTILLRHLPSFQEPPETLRAIAVQFGVNEQTLYTHWREKCLPRLRLIAFRFDRSLQEALNHPEAQTSLKNCQLHDCPEGTAWELVNRLILAPEAVTLSAIARELNVPESHLWQQWEQHCVPLLLRLKHYSAC